MAQSETIPGVQEWTNPLNGFHVVRVHYTADPEKRSSDWAASARAGLPQRGWLREYEISWTAPEGEPVVPEFDPGRHIAIIRPDRGLRLLRFWDFGRVTPAVLFAQMVPTGQLRILRELVPFNTPLDSLLDMVRAVTLDLGLSERPAFDAGDPAATAETDLGSVIRVLRDASIYLATTRPGTESSYERLRARFRDSLFEYSVRQLVPAIIVDTSCRTLIEALAGAFHLSPHPPYKPIKVHPFKDVVDALRYGNDNLAPMNLQFQQAMRQLATNDCVW